MSFSSWLRSVFARQQGLSRPAPKQCRLSLETLDDRSLPSFVPTSLAIDGTVLGSAVGDFNKDGRDDVAVVSRPLDFGSDRLSVFLGQADGSFIPAGPIGGYLVGTNASHAAAGDINGDGKLDVVVLNDQSSVRVMLGNGDGTLSTKLYSTSVSRSYSLAVADLNNDGKSDVVLGGNASVTVLLAKKGGGTTLFNAAQGYQTSGWYSTAVAIGYVNGDGKRDIVTIDDPGDLAFYGGTSRVSVLAGRGDGTFEPTRSFALPTSSARDLALGDFNNDSNRDLAVAAGAELFVLNGNGDGTFGNPTTPISAFDDAGADTVAVADFDRDGKLDIATSDFYGSLWMVRGNGDGTFAPAEYLDGGGYTPVLVGNFNGDGYADLTAGAEVLRNAADWGVQVAARFEITGPYTGVVQAGQPFSLTITVYDQDGNSMSNYTGTIHFTSSDGRAILPADYTFTTDDTGTVTIDGFILRAKKWQSITVSDTTDADVTGTIYLFVQ